MRYITVLLLLSLFCVLPPLSGQVIESTESFYKAEAYNDWLVKDGQLYLATDVGIFIFDETTQSLIEHWTVTSVGLPSNQVESMALHPATQSIFIGTYDIGAAFQTPEGEWQLLPYPEEMLQPFTPIKTHAVEFDTQGRLLIGSNQGLWRNDGGDQWERFNSTYFDGLIHGVWDLVRTPAGEIYIGGNVVAQTAGDEFVVISPTESPIDLFSYSDTDLYYHSDGSLWVFTDIGTSGHYANGEWEVRNPWEHTPILTLESEGFVFENAGALWKYTRNGRYFRYDESGWAAYEEAIPFDFAEPEMVIPLGEQWLGLRESSVYTLTDDGPETLHDLSNWPWPTDELWIFNYDHEANLWVRTSPQTLLNLTTNEELDLSFLGTDFYSYEYYFGAAGELWLFGPDYSLWHVQDGELANVYTPENTVFAPGTYFRDFTLSEDGTPWLLNGDEQLYTLQDGSWQEVAAFPVGQYILDLQPGAGSNCYLTRLVSGQISIMEIAREETAYHSLPDNWSGSYFRNFPGETPGTLWTFNEVTAQLALFDGENWSYRDFPAGWDFAGGDRPHHLVERAGRLWIAGSFQMAFYDGEEWSYYNLDDRYWNSTRIYEAGIDINGEIWLTHNGVQVVSHLTTSWGITGSEELPVAGNETPLTVWPNPATTSVRGHWTPGDLLQIRDMQGRVLQTVEIAVAQQAIITSTLPQGAYQLLLMSEEGLKVGRLLKVEQ